MMKSKFYTQVVLLLALALWGAGHEQDELYEAMIAIAEKIMSKEELSTLFERLVSS